MRAVLLLDERILSDGSHARTWARLVGDRVQIVDDDGTHGQLSIEALDRVMTRYGRALDPGVGLDGDPLALPCADGYSCSCFRWCRPPSPGRSPPQHWP